MENHQDPVVLELAPLPREQVGPFLLLGISKAVDQEDIEASWAQRVIWARKRAIRTPLEDVNWAREVINDFERRVQADVTSLNLDTTNGVLEHLRERYGGIQAHEPAWHPLDREKPLADYHPPAHLPGLDEVRAAIRVPDIPAEMAVVGRILEEYARETLDPWNLPFAATNPKAASHE
jgi:hypothetical protein